MINFINWGLDHEDEGISLFFVVFTVSTLVAWISGLAIALIFMNLEAIVVLSLPAIYVFPVLYKWYRQERIKK